MILMAMARVALAPALFSLARRHRLAVPAMVWAFKGPMT